MYLKKYNLTIKMFALIKKIKKIILSYNKFLISKIKIYSLRKYKENIFIELGSGDRKGNNNWLTIDITKKCDIFWDLRNGIPFPNNSVNKIYSSHFFEHLTYQEGQKMLDECLRVLKPEGIFSICVPNARLYVDAYLSSEFDTNKLIGHKPAFNNTSRIDYLNYTAYMDGEHKYMFDEENLIFILKSKGMKNVSIREFDPNLDLEVRDFESIYATAIK